MKFRTKMILTYSAFVMLIAVLMSGIYCHYMSVRSREEAYHTLNLRAVGMSHNYEMKLNGMNAVMKYITSSGRVLSDLRLLSGAQTDSRLMEERDDVLQELSDYISNDYIYTTSYRTLLYNQYGDVAATQDFGMTKVREGWELSELDGAETAQLTPGKMYLTGAHRDEWGEKQNPEVFSVIKCLNGEQYGFVEVQCLVSDLTVLEPSENGVGYLIFNKTGDLIYASEKLREQEWPDRQEWSADPDNGKTSGTILGKKTGSGTQKKDMICVLKNETYGFVVAAVWLETGQTQEWKGMVVYSLLIGLFFILISILFVYASARYLTRPIDELKTLIDGTQVEDLSSGKKPASGNDEIGAVIDSYQKLLGRLGASLEKEKKISTLNLKTQLDMLQAQIHPHFIYNVLNVISNRGVLDQDMEICNICGSLAAMLRYATDTREKVTSVRNEVNYLRQYCTLIRARFEDKITFEEDIAPEAAEYRLPKAILQQLVENCVEHGPDETVSGLVIRVNIAVTEEGWSVCVRDNGVGFAEEKRRGLERHFRDIKDRVTDERQIYESKIGGMGLSSVYARMYLQYGERFSMSLKNEGGAVILLVVKNEA